MDGELEQVFVVGPIRLEQDAHGYGVSVLINENPETYEVQANFKEPMDMLIYAQQLAISIFQQQQFQRMNSFNQIDGEE